MGNKLYVGNLPYSVRDGDLEQAFSQFGAVTSAKVMMERETGRSREIDRGARRGAYRDQHRDRGPDRLLHDLEPRSSRDGEHTIRERYLAAQHTPADDLVDRVVTADILAQAEELALRVEQPGAVEPAALVEERLMLAQASRQRLDQSVVDRERGDRRQRHLEAFDALLAANTARSGGAERARPHPRPAKRSRFRGRPRPERQPPAPTSPPPRGRR